MLTFISLKEIINGLRIHFFASSVHLPYISSSYPPNQIRSACFSPARAKSSIQMNNRANACLGHAEEQPVSMHAAV